MRFGDLSNEVVPRIVLVFEGALGVITAEERRKFDKDIQRERWMEATRHWVLHEQMMLKIWDITRRQGMNLDVVTFAGPEEFGEALAYRLQEVEDLPIRQVWATRVEVLARKIAYMQDLAKIYDPDRSRFLTWGGKGYHLTDINQLGS